MIGSRYSRYQESGPSCSQPLHVKRAEKALDLNVFLQQCSNRDSESSDEDSDIIVDDDSDDSDSSKLADSMVSPYKEHFSFNNNCPRREWLYEVLQEEIDTEDRSLSVAERYKKLLKEHAWKKSLLKKDPQDVHYNFYFGSGIISNFDKFIDSKKGPITFAKPTRAKSHRHEMEHKLPLYNLPMDYSSDSRCVGLNVEIGIDPRLEDELNMGMDIGRIVMPQYPNATTTTKKRTKKFKDEESRKKWEDIMTVKRRKIFTNIVKKEIGKQHRAKMNKHKEIVIQCKRVAQHCQKAARQKALQSARTVKEQLWRMKRLARENLAYWRRSKRVDREIRRKLEKEAEEQRKMDFELIEAKRQQRKLNFLITQTELYAHFMSKKIGKASPEEQLRILSQLDEEKNPRLANIDDYDSESMKAKAKKNAQEAFQNERSRTKHFDVQANSQISEEAYSDGEHPQPTIFRGVLKGYQLRGMNWLANLYDQGISGILADEMGLGKTVQSIAFLCHIAEKYSVWGPFLIISPASTLHNWQQELAKFVPDFKVVPYWGNPNERKILRQFWDQKDMHTKEASFHIVVTSYQIVISDIKYFNRIKWQYMILDEAQAIKSTSSMRWKTLLGFSCRNRLLLSGTPIQNSMAELWALLHFIMPTLFDSHEEFNEWFSKDIESHAENKTGIDEKHLSRLHMILKPFMLRRIKKDVENELSDKIEVMVYCPLTTRQKLLYMALKQKIRIEDLLHYTVGGGDSHVVDKNFTSNLMNLVMQFRKVCNHPELFERRDAKSPIYLKPFIYNIPYLVYDTNCRLEYYLLLNKYFVFTSKYIEDAVRNEPNTIFNFCHYLGLSYQQFFAIFQGSLLHRWKSYFEIEDKDYLLSFRKLWWEPEEQPTLRLRYDFKLSPQTIDSSVALTDLIFTRKNTAHKIIYTHTTHNYHWMPETVAHRNIRLKHATNPSEEHEPIIDVVNDDKSETKGNKPRQTQILTTVPTTLPNFLFCRMPKVESGFPLLYCYSRRAAWHLIRHIDDYSWTSLNWHWSETTGDEVVMSSAKYFQPITKNPINKLQAPNGWSNITIPDKESLVTDSGKLSVLDGLLRRLKEEGHRILIYSQMTKMIDLLEEYMWHRHHKYMRLDGSSKISERRDMVADFQARADIFVFLLSTRAGGLGINLTAADTVIFYDSDWNPTVDQQAMDRAHRLGQTKQVTVYRLICKGSIEERILQRAREKSEIQKLVISGGNFKPDSLKPKEVVSLLLDDEELEQKYRQRTEERKHLEDLREMDKKRKHMMAFKTIPATDPKRLKPDGSMDNGTEDWFNLTSAPNSPRSDISHDDINDVDVEGDSINSKYTVYNLYGTTVKPRTPARGTSKRGRPRGSRRVSALGRFTGATLPPPPPPPPVPTASTPDDFPLPSTFMDVPLNTQQSYVAIPAMTRRGPGRPRLKPGGPANQGTRGSYRPRKPAKPLPVPLPSDSSSSRAAASYSSYLYDFPDQGES